MCNDQCAAKQLLFSAALTKRQPLTVQCDTLERLGKHAVSGIFVSTVASAARIDAVKLR